MGNYRSGRGLAILAFLVSLVALGVSLLAYREAGGGRALEEQIRILQGALDAARRETAAGLDRLERVVRPPDGPGRGPAELKR